MKNKLVKSTENFLTIELHAMYAVVSNKTQCGSFYYKIPLPFGEYFYWFVICFDKMVVNTYYVPVIALYFHLIVMGQLIPFQPLVYI